MGKVEIFEHLQIPVGQDPCHGFILVLNKDAEPEPGLALALDPRQEIGNLKIGEESLGQQINFKAILRLLFVCQCQYPRMMR